MLSRIILGLLVIISAREAYHQSETFLDEGGPPNVDLARDIFPYAKAVFITFSALRVIFFIACLQWPHLAKLSLYFEYSFYVIRFFLVQDINTPSDTHMTTLMIIMDFLLCYFEFMPGLIASLFALVLTYFKRAVFFEEPALDLAIDCAIQSVFVSVNLVIIHLIISKVGMIYTDAEVLRQGNDQTLNNLEEGVIILDEKDLQIQFQNKAAEACKNMKRRQDSALFDLMGDEKPTYAQMVKENSNKQFADIDIDFIRGKTIVDTQAAIDHVKASKDYKSIQEIIEQSIKDKFP